MLTSSKIKQLFEKYREIIVYLIFGVLTTIVGMGSYFIILRIGGLISGDVNAEPSYLLRTIAQILQWIFSVLFAFFTNRKYVFLVKSNESTTKQLIKFSSTRVVTLLLDTLITFSLVALLDAVSYVTIWIFTKDFIAKFVAAVFVVIGNYILSKFLVFKNK